MNAVYLFVVLIIGVPTGIVLWIAVCHGLFARYHQIAGLSLRPVGWAGIVGYYWRLLKATLLISGWTLRNAGPNDLWRPAGQVTGPPVLCVHGFFRNGSCTWGIRRFLERHGRPTQAVSMGRPFRPIESYAPALEMAMRELIDAFPGERIDVIAHSMGGVILRWVLARRPDLAAKVGRVITLGSPHRGTALVSGLALRPSKSVLRLDFLAQPLRAMSRFLRSRLMAPEHRQLEPGSPFLKQLPDFRSSIPEAEATTVAAERDFIVYPRDSSHLPGARAIDIAHINHQSLLCDPAVLRLLLELLPARA